MASLPISPTSAAVKYPIYVALLLAVTPTWIASLWTYFEAVSINLRNSRCLSSLVLRDGVDQISINNKISEDYLSSPKCWIVSMNSRSCFPMLM